uniref:hypothetical protein n=1 Tax=Pararhizobium sp. IMCC3301 TaxID=3067904 RepID=UPI0027416119|nr:hypothetical protein [Pararhizobium sp. IMCC3301]
MTMRETSNVVDPIDVQIGGDGDSSGMGRSLTADDMNALLYSSEPLETRRAQLLELRDELRARVNVDLGNDHVDLLRSVEDALAQLDDGSADETGSRETLGMDSASRSDGQALDEQEPD